MTKDKSPLCIPPAGPMTVIMMMKIRDAGAEFSDLRESLFSRILKIFFEISLLDLDFQSFLFHFHSLKRVKGKNISPFFSGKKSEI